MLGRVQAVGPEPFGLRAWIGRSLPETLSAWSRAAFLAPERTSD
jgi:hypothetical protein